jgi:hypothetical protein
MSGKKKPVPPTRAVEPTTPQVAARIHTLRGVQVLFDRDLALFFDVKPIRLREQVKRNANRFPEDFMFQLTRDEAMEMVSQNAIPSIQQLGGALPYAFTEEGVAALSAVLRSERAVEVGIQIVRAFVAMRKFIFNHAQIFERLDHVERRQILADQKFEQIFTALENHDAQPRSQGIFFNGQIFDAYTFATSLIKQAKKSIVLVDNYVDESVLLMLAKRALSVAATIYTKKISREFALDIQKHNAQYPAVEVRTIPDFHDRFLILDSHTLYHIGASLKDLGKKCFAFSRMDSLAPEILARLLTHPTLTTQRANSE